MSVRTRRFRAVGRPARWSGGRRRSERGAVAVEYALGISLIVLALIGSIEALNDWSAEELDDRSSSIGSPDLDETGNPAPPPSTQPPTSDPNPPPPPESVITVSLDEDTDRQGQEWSASVTATALDELPRVRESVLVQAQWTSTAPGFVPVTIQCTTNLNGDCTMTIRSLSRGSVPDVTLTVLQVSGPGVLIGPLPAPITMSAP